jgi:MFS family permease
VRQGGQRVAHGLTIQRGALAAACAVLYLTFLDMTVVSVTLGSVQADLHAGVMALQWVVNAYALVFACLMFVMGSLGDRLGRKRVMVAGITVFCAASVVAALAPTVAVLIAARAVMGVGAAASEPATLSILRHVFPEHRTRAHALAAWSAVSGLALATGPVIGGLLVGVGGWPAVFWFNVGAGGLALLGAVRYVPESADPPDEPLDAAGFALGAVALGCGVFATIAGESAGYDVPWILLLFAACALAMIGFLRVESRRRRPMVNVHYLADPVVAGSLAVAFAVYFAVFSIFFFTALYLQEVVGYTGWRVAGLFAPMAVAIMLGSVLAGRWVARGGAGAPMVTGCLLGAVGIWLTQRYLGLSPPLAALAIALTIAGLGFGITIVPVTSAVMGGVPAQDSGMAAAAVNTSRQLGAVVGVAVLGSLVNAHLTADLGGRLNDLGVPANFQTIVIDAIERGTVPHGADATAMAAYGAIVNQVIGATYAAFHDGLTTALLLSAGLLLVAALTAGLTQRPPRALDRARRYIARATDD